jgi:hypothetical protein
LPSTSERVSATQPPKWLQGKWVLFQIGKQRRHPQPIFDQNAVQQPNANPTELSLSEQKSNIQTPVADCQTIFETMP